jgi:hypothetical protein
MFSPNGEIQISQRKQTLQPGSEDYIALEALERELLFRREMSIRSQVRAVVLDTLNSISHPDAKKIASQALKIYDKRSTLVHEGCLPPTELHHCEQEARQIVEIVLKAKLTST